MGEGAGIFAKPTTPDDEWVGGEGKLAFAIDVDPLARKQHESHTNYLVSAVREQQHADNLISTPTRRSYRIMQSSLLPHRGT